MNYEFIKEVVILRILRPKSPFKVNEFEYDPNAFALRKEEISFCVQNLFHERNILIYGPRAIGKSSMGIQLQKMLMGDKTLLTRCDIDSDFPKYLCTRIPCNKQDSISQVAYNILCFLERQYNKKLKSINYKDKKYFLKFNLGVLQAGVETKIDSTKYSPTTIATILTSELANALKIIIESGIYQGINVMIDELDYLSPDINFAHFIKTVYEMLSTEGAKHISFIFAGNTGIYNHLWKGDPSFSRIINTVKIPILKAGELEFILDYAGATFSPPFKIEDKGKELIVSLSSGFPHIPHLLGDAGFKVMKDESNMTFDDIKIGIDNILMSDKKEEYLSVLREISEEDRELITNITKYEQEDKTLPVEIPIEWIKEEFGDKLVNGKSTKSILDSLVKGGYIKKNKERAHYVFSEELFRVFITLARLEREEVLINKGEELEYEKIKNFANENLLNEIRSGKLDLDTDLTHEERKEVIKKLRKSITNSKSTRKWEETEWFDFL